jgi:CheY-like chemotaxis protein
MDEVRILYVEDNGLLRLTLQETLEAEGWRVEACADGREGWARIESAARYDVLLLDNELPFVCGVELVRRARRLSHRGRTPVIVVSASECAREAREAGADVFLKKPEEIERIVETVGRLLLKKVN